MTLEKIKQLVKSNQYHFLCDNPHLGQNIILIGLGGSHAYGTNNEQSDLDIRGCALNSKEEILTNVNFEQFVNEETDTTIYSFNKLVHLLSNCNPNTIEILGLKEEHYLYVSSILQELCYDVANHSLAAYENLGYESDLITRIATLLHDIGKPHCYQDDTNGTRHFKGHGKVSADMYKILKRLRFDNYTIDKVVELVHYHDATFEESRKSVKRWLNKIGEEQFRRLIKLRSADIQAQSDKNMKERLDKLDRILNILDDVLTEQSCFQIKAINGHDLIACGVPEGKLIGYILKSLLDMVIEDNVQNNRNELFKAVNGLFAANPQLYVTNNGKH